MNPHELTVNALQDKVHAWANETFPYRTPAIAWLKLFEELGEVIKNPEDPLEWADVFILLLDLASMHEVSIPEACMDKMVINSARDWVVGPTGVMQHVEGERGGFDLSMINPIDPKTEPQLIPSLTDAICFHGGHKDGVTILNARMAEELYSTWWVFGPDGGCYYLDEIENEPAGEKIRHYKWGDDGIPF